MRKNTEERTPEDNKVDRIEIEYFTDPLCCWSWAFEPHWRKFINENKQLITWRYRMGGLLRDWTNYSDPMNDVSRPAQMGPLWLQVKYTTGTAINPNIWLTDPPSSSLPACMGVKCAELQSVAAADILLILLRNAVMTEEKNITRQEVIFDCALKAQDKYKIIDFSRFKKDWETTAPKLLLKEDLHKVKMHDIGRFPTITMKAENGKGLILVGYRPYDVLMEAFRDIAGIKLHEEMNLK